MRYRWLIVLGLVISSMHSSGCAGLMTCPSSPGCKTTTTPPGPDSPTPGARPGEITRLGSSQCLQQGQSVPVLWSAGPFAIHTSVFLNGIATDLHGVLPDNTPFDAYWNICNPGNVSSLAVNGLAFQLVGVGGEPALNEMYNVPVLAPCACHTQVRSFQTGLSPGSYNISLPNFPGPGQTTWTVSQ